MVVQGGPSCGCTEVLPIRDGSSAVIFRKATTIRALLGVLITKPPLFGLESTRATDVEKLPGMLPAGSRVRKVLI